MTLDEVLDDIRSLVGLPLHSIKEGADLTVTQVVDDGVWLRRFDGEPKFRKMHEFDKIIRALNANPGGAVHVDTTLNGSAPSRNQPETIFANLPYIEVVYLDGKKHIKLVPAPSHAIGTILVAQEG
jgi:hypothetical protein